MGVWFPKTIKSLWNESKKSLHSTRKNRSLRARGDLLRDARRFSQASEAYTKYLKRIKDDFDIWVQNGHCLKEAGHLTQAKNAYDFALSLRSDDADLYLQIGHLSKLMKNPIEAFHAYDKSFKLSQSQDAAVEIQNIKSFILENKKKDLPSLSSIVSLKEEALVEMAAIHESIQVSNKKAAIKLMTSLSININNSTRDHDLSQQIKTVSLFITKNSIVLSGEV